jgi:hypothetical protein
VNVGVDEAGEEKVVVAPAVSRDPMDPPAADLDYTGKNPARVNFDDVPRDVER